MSQKLPVNDENINIDASFTSLFALMKKYRPVNDSVGFDYTICEISKMLIHADNIMVSLMHGLQIFGKLVTTSSLSNNEDITQIGYFLSLVANLLEAVHLLRLDCDYGLINEKRKISN